MEISVCYSLTDKVMIMPFNIKKSTIMLPLSCNSVKTTFPFCLTSVLSTESCKLILFQVPILISNLHRKVLHFYNMILTGTACSRRKSRHGMPVIGIPICKTKKDLALYLVLSLFNESTKS